MIEVLSRYMISFLETMRRRASIRTLSRIIPINSSTVAGPCVLLGATGMLRFLNVSIVAVKLCWPALSCGGS